VLQEAFRKRKRKRGLGAVGKSWRLDETYIKIGGKIVTGIVPWINKAYR
jgi:transposase-like protein